MKSSGMNPWFLNLDLDPAQKSTKWEQWDPEEQSTYMARLHYTNEKSSRHLKILF